MPIVTVSATGRLALPAAYRKALGIGPHSRVEVLLADGELVIRPLRSICEVRGAFRRCANGAGWERERAEAEVAVARQVGRG